jgi:predicted O-methyltransferase YrrM
VILENCRAWGFDKLDLIAGNVVETTKAYVHDNLGSRISLLYIDVDNYEGALACLQNLYPIVSPGGLVVFDEYALRNYGESNAVDEFFKGKNLRLRSIPWANTPSAYMIKESF